MLKLIASDLDGTLLDGEGRLPAEVFPLIEALAGRGALFAVASGRQYACLAQMFAPVADKVVFLCENGALVRYRGKTLRLAPVPDALLSGTLDAIRADEALCPILCGTECAYFDRDDADFYALTAAAYPALQKVDDLKDVIGREHVCKISVYDGRGAAEYCLRTLPKKLPALRTQISGKVWCDVSAPEANKGHAFAFLRRYFSLNIEECATFGDHMNDYEMLKECGHGYAFVPENAYPPLKKAFPNVIPANTRGGVLTTIRTLLSQATGPCASRRQGD